MLIVACKITNGNSKVGRCLNCSPYFRYFVVISQFSLQLNNTRPKGLPVKGWLVVCKKYAQDFLKRKFTLKRWQRFDPQTRQAINTYSLKQRKKSRAGCGLPSGQYTYMPLLWQPKFESCCHQNHFWKYFTRSKRRNELTQLIKNKKRNDDHIRPFEYVSETKKINGCPSVIVNCLLSGIMQQN